MKIALQFFCLMILAFTTNFGYAQDYHIYPKEDANKKVILKVGDTDSLKLLLTKKRKEADTISLVISSFVGDLTGAEINPTFTILSDSAHYNFSQFNGDTTTKLNAKKITGISDIIIDKSILPLQLNIPDLPSYQSYSGTLVVSRKQEEVTSYQLVIQAEPDLKADLYLDMPSSSQKYTRPAFGEKGGPEFIWHISEKNKKERLKGVYAELNEYSSSHGDFYPKRDITFEFQGKEIEDFWGIQPNEIQKRTVEIGEQAEIRAKLNSLPAGEYTAKIKFAATNTKPDDDNNVATLTLKVKDHYLWAAFWLTMAIVFSFFTNKWLNTRRQKLELRQKISDLNPAWLRLEPPSIGIIKARSTLKLVEDLTNRFYISSSDLIHDKLEEVKVLIKYLDRCRKLRKMVESMGLVDMKYRRALKNYRKISDKIGSDKIDDTLAAEIEADLDNQESWFQPGQFDEYYGKDLQKDVDHLLSGIGEAKEFPEKLKKDFDELLEKLGKDKSGTEKQENLYAVVKVLWERRYKSKLVENLMVSYKQHGSVKLLFNEVDRLEWKNLKSVRDQSEFNFVRPKLNSLEPPQTFQPLWLEVSPQDSTDADNYLFKHGLEYKWEVTIKPEKGKLSNFWDRITGKGEKEFPQLKSTTREPKIVQFIPKRSEIDYQVTVCYHDPENKTDTFSIHEGGVKIAPSTIFTINKAFQKIEVFALIASWLVAGISGLLTFYFKNDTFGQLSDYITLFLWGAGVDQTKNFIQNYQAYGRKSEQETKKT